MSCICEFCYSEFSAKFNLTHHQKTAKYCLKLQGKETIYKCKKCNKELCDKRHLDTHEQNCISQEGKKNTIALFREKEQELKEFKIDTDKQIIILQQQLQSANDTITLLKEQISELQSRLENVAVQGVKKSTTTTNNIVNIENLTDEWLRTSSKNLTLDHIQRGPQGYAEFASQHSLKDRVQCVDFSRRILQYKEDDAIIRDKKGKKLSRKFFQSIESQNKELIMQAMAKIREEMDDKTPEELDSLIEKMTKFLDMNSTDIVQNQELKESFVKELCELL
jgi:hypothetical protein